MWDNILTFTHTVVKCEYALNCVCLLSWTSKLDKCCCVLHRTDRASWSTTELNSHSHIQITNYVYSKSHCRNASWDLTGSIFSLSPDIILSSSVSPPLPASHPSCLSFSLLSLQSDQELILWILTLIQWDSYNPLSDYGATNTLSHVHAHSDTHMHAHNTHTKCIVHYVNTRIST